MAVKELDKKKTVSAGQNVKERDYWLNRLSGEWGKSFFPYDHPGHDGQKSMGRCSFRIEGQCFSDLMRLRNDSDYRLFMILTAQLVLLLYKYTGSNDILLGTAILKQDIEADFINTVLTLRNTFERDVTFKDLLLLVRGSIVEAAEYQNYPVESILHKLHLVDSGGLSDASSGFPLFDVTLLLDNIHDKTYIEHIPVNMAFRFNRTETAVEGLVEYNTFCYSASMVEGIVSHYIYLISNMTASLDIPLYDIGILSEEERKQLSIEFNNTEGEYPEGKTIHGLFEEQAMRTPDSLAAVHSGTHGTNKTYMSYSELNKKSTQLAHYLIEKGLGPGSIVAIMMERSLEMLVAILGILKAGGAYLPIDVNYPESRIRYMLEDSGAKIVVTPETFAEVENQNAVHVVTGLPNTGPDQPIYLIYTSGSTGRPKGVLLAHKNVVNLLHFDLNHTNLDFSKVLQFHTIGFDASFHEIFCALLSGGVIYMIEEETRADIPALFEVVKKNQICTLFLPMSYLRIIFNEENYVRLIPSCVKHIQTAGEQVVVNNRFKRFLQENHVYLHNHYGPAETHVVTALTMAPGEDIPELPSIGKPILNTQIYILDKDKQLVPVGVPGELYIGGIQVGKGYLNRPELTAERFIDKSFSEVQGAVFQKSPLPAGGNLYRTGDLARWLPDGNIQFLGRVDKQVKIRGFRIEPGEIESQLIDIDYIKEAAVVDRTDEKGDKFLAAYVVSGMEIDITVLRETLAEKLPDYMVPSYFFQLEEIPLTPNGKVDRAALKAMELETRKKVHVPPRTEKEKELCLLWSEILGLEKEAVGIDDNFFEMGGHSLKATILITRIHRAFNVKISLGEVFNRPTVRGLARFIEEAEVDEFASIKPVGEREYYPVSSPQKRMYIANQLDQKSVNYNMPVAMFIDGEVDIEKFETVYRQLIQRQEGLRTKFVVAEGEPVQQIETVENILFSIQQYDPGKYGAGDFENDSGKIDESSPFIKAMIEDFVRPFDLSRAPLFRAGLAKLAEKKYLFMVDIHHIIGDGISLGILVREFTSLYDGQDLPPLAVCYRDYAVWRQSSSFAERLKQQEAYWMHQLGADIQPVDLPLDFPRSGVKRFEGRWVRFEIDADTTKQLKELAEQNDATLYMVLLAGFNVLLHKYTRSETIVVGTAIAGRSHPDLENIIGVFLNTLVMKNNPKGHLTFIEFLLEVRENALAAYENQDYQFEELVDKLSLNRDPKRNPVFDIMFNVQNTEIPEIKIRDITLTPCRIDIGAVKLDVKINIEEYGDILRCTLDHVTSLFKPETMDAFIDNFKKVIQQVTADPTMKISAVQLMSEEVKKEMLDQFTEELEYEF